jgi:hypothetical protein
MRADGGSTGVYKMSNVQKKTAKKKERRKPVEKEDLGPETATIWDESDGKDAQGRNAKISP